MKELYGPWLPCRTASAIASGIAIGWGVVSGGQLEDNNGAGLGADMTAGAEELTAVIEGIIVVVGAAPSSVLTSRSIIKSPLFET